VTIRDYLNPANFPLSTRPGETVCRQMRADAMRHDDFLDNPPPEGTPEAALFDELKRKLAAWDDPQLDAEMKADAAARGIPRGWGILAGCRQ